MATSLGIEVRDVRVLAEGDLDSRGTLGVAKQTERYCVVLQTLRRLPEVSTRMERVAR